MFKEKVKKLSKEVKATSFLKEEWKVRKSTKAEREQWRKTDAMFRNNE